MPSIGSIREVRVNYTCSHCNRSGTGFKTEECTGHSQNGSPWWKTKNKSIPEGWEDVGLGTLLCDSCVNNPKARNVAQEQVKYKAIGCLILVVIALIAFGIYCLVQ